MSQFFNISLNILTLKNRNIPDKTKKNLEASILRGFTLNGGRYKTRTCDLPHVKRMRYQLRQSSGSLTACLYYTMKDEMSIPFLFFFVPLRGRKIKIKDTENRYLTVLGILAQKEGFEPSRALYTPTPLAGEPLRPLGYFCMPLKYDSTA